MAESEYITNQKKRVDQQFQIAFAKQNISYDYFITNNDELLIVIPELSGKGCQYRSIRVVDEDGKTYTSWEPAVKISPMQLLKREITGRAFRV